MQRIKVDAVTQELGNLQQNLSAYLNFNGEPIETDAEYNSVLDIQREKYNGNSADFDHFLQGRLQYIHNDFIGLINKLLAEIVLLRDEALRNELLNVREKAEDMAHQFSRLIYLNNKRRKAFSSFTPEGKKSFQNLVDSHKIKRDQNYIYDAKHAVNGNGTALCARFMCERFDPLHRTWGVVFQSPGKAMLDKTWDEWSANLSDLNLYQYAEKEIPKDTPFGSYVYYTEEEASQYQVNMQDGRVRYAHNENELPDNIPFSDNEKYIYSIDLSGNLYIGQEGPVNPEENFPRRQHPSFTRGENVICAGTLKITNGRITYIDNESGHYAPGPFALNKAISVLEEKGWVDNNLRVFVRSSVEDDVERKSFNKEIDVAAFKHQIDGMRNKYGMSLLSSIDQVGQYFKKRAHETRTSWIGLKFGYTGGDYYRRRSDWTEILELLSRENVQLDEVNARISTSIARFSKRIGRNDYAKQLRQLQSVLGQAENGFNLKFVKDEIAKTRVYYAGLDEMSSAYAAVGNSKTAEAAGQHLESVLNTSSNLWVNTEKKSRLFTRRELFVTEALNYKSCNR